VKVRTVRPARPGDAAGIAGAQVGGWLAAYRGVVPDHVLDDMSVDRATEHWRGRLVEGLPGMWVCELADRRGEEGLGVVGFVYLGATHDEDVDAGQVGEVYALYVVPSHWRQGHGRALMELATQQLRAQGYSEATLWVLRDNRIGRGFYEALGWEWDGGEQSKEWRPGIFFDLVRYRRTLQPSAP
jgi:GNAT superfamily N-acetyltransferase